MRRSLLLLVLGLMLSMLLTASCPLAAQQPVIRVALFIDDGTEASEFRKEFRRNNDATITYRKVNGEDIRDGALRNFDALMIPGGSATTEAYSMEPEGREEIRRFVRDGGIYLGVCAGAYLASSLKDCYLGMLPLKTYDEEHWYRTAGAPLIDVELTPAGMEVFGFTQKNIRIVYEDGPIFSPPFEAPDPSFTPLGYFRSEVVAAGGQPGVMIGAPAMILSRYGRGIVLVISPHPEETPGMEQVELHALRWLYDHRSPGGTPTDSGTLPAKISIAAGSGTAKLAKQSATQESSEPANFNERVLQTAQKTFDDATIVRYEHNEVPASQQIEIEANGNMKALTDCSGFVSYVVHKVSPRHYQVVRDREPGAAYPQAKIWARFFGSLVSDGPQDGWMGVADWRRLQPGDIVAWKIGKKGATNTGHVMIVAGRPSDIQQDQGYRFVEIPVIDSSSVYHFKPEYLPPKAYQKHRNGLGCGCVRLVLSDDDTPIGYWEGTYWGEGDKPVDGPTFSKVIHFARMVPFADTITR